VGGAIIPRRRNSGSSYQNRNWPRIAGIPLMSVIREPKGIRNTSSGVNNGRPVYAMVVPKVAVRLVENVRLENELLPELQPPGPEPELLLLPDVNASPSVWLSLTW